MKNKYSFDYLNKIALQSKEDEAEIFFKMNKIVRTGSLICSLECINDLFLKLDKEMYYISHNCIMRKGKQKFFMGRTFKTQKEDLKIFLKKSHEMGDIRSLIISPFFWGAPDKAIFLDDEQIIIYNALLDF